MEQPSFWTHEYSAGLSTYSNGPRTRTVDIGEHKLSLPTQTSSQRPIDRFNSGEGPLPMGLLPNPVHAYPPMLPTAVPGLTFSPTDQDADSWHSSIREDDRNSLSTDSGISSRNVNSNTWNPRGSVSGLSDYQSSSVPMAFQETAPSPPETTYQYRASEVIDPSLTLNYQDTDIFGCKEEPTIKFELSPPCFIDDGDYEPEYCAESPNNTQFPYYDHDHYAILHSHIPGFSNDWAHKSQTPVTRSQSQNEGKSQVSSQLSGNVSRKGSKTPKNLSPNSSKKLFRRRNSSSSDESPTRNNTRPKTYRRKVPFYTCQEDECKTIRFKNRSELKKHTETQHTKPYICVFGFANCTQRFGARNEWKRHIATQHLVLYKYVCDHPRCRDKPKAKIQFNRGDLFNKHQERMHLPVELQDRKHDDLDLIQWKNEMRQAKARCEELRTPPKRMTCGFCAKVFEQGDKTWMELIDHVGLHYQRGDIQSEWQDDLDLIAWMRDNGLYNEDDVMEVESETPDSRKSRKHSYSSSSDSSSARQIKQEQMEI